jgi:hypothetical protein
MPRSCRNLRAAERRLALSFQLALEHRGERNIQDFADLEQASRADAVRPFFVLLNLLKRDTQFRAEVGLAHIEREPPLAQPGADKAVDGAW